MGRGQDLKLDYIEFKTYHILLLWLWENHFNSLGLSFLIHKMETIACWFKVRIKWNNTLKIGGISNLHNHLKWAPSTTMLSLRLSRVVQLT